MPKLFGSDDVIIMSCND